MAIQQITIPVLMTFEVEAEDATEAGSKVQAAWDSRPPVLEVEGEDVLVDFYPVTDKTRADLGTLEVVEWAATF